MPTSTLIAGCSVMEVTVVRQHLRRTVGLGREQVSMVAYWRHRDHAPDPGDPDD